MIILHPYCNSVDALAQITLYDDSGHKMIESKRMTSHEAAEIAAITEGDEYEMSKSCKIYIDSIVEIDHVNSENDGNDNDVETVPRSNAVKRINRQTGAFKVLRCAFRFMCSSRTVQIIQIPDNKL